MEQEMEIIIKDKFGDLTVENAKAFRVVDLNTKRLAAERRNLADEMEKLIHRELDDKVKSAHATWKGLTELRAKYLETPQTIRRIYMLHIQEYDEAQEKKRREEAQRIEAEQRRQEEERRLLEAAALEKEGYREEAEAVLSEPIYVPTITIPEPKEEKVQSYRDNWSAEIYDLMALVKAVAGGTVPLAGIIGIEPKNSCYQSTFWNQQARSLRSMLSAPGVKAINNRIPLVIR